MLCIVAILCKYPQTGLGCERFRQALIYSCCNGYADVIGVITINIMNVTVLIVIMIFITI